MKTEMVRLLGYACTAALVAAAGITFAVISPAVISSSPRRVTNTTSGKNQNPNVDETGGLIVFTSNTNHVSGVANPAIGTFDFDNSGTDFTLMAATHPNPQCANCDGNTDTARPGDIYLWHLKSWGSAPANSIAQLTFSKGGGFAANHFPDINEKGHWVAWDSDRNHTGANADGNREIFLADLTACNFSTPSGTPPCPITQVTNTTGGSDTANRNVNLDDHGTLLVFDSNRDYAGVLGCTLTDGTTACDNSDGNSEIMLYDIVGMKLTQITKTTGNGDFANIRPRISRDGRFIAFQSTRDFSGVLPAGVPCTLSDGTSTCTNSDGNGEIMFFDRGTLGPPAKFTQITNTPNTGACTGNTPNQRVEISKGHVFVSFQSTCELYLNPTGCVSCDGNDEAFLYSVKTGRLTQLTISKGGFNQVPHVSGKGGWIIFESDRNYVNSNPGNSRAVYIIRRSTKPGSSTQTGPGQMVDDPGPPTPPSQNPMTKPLVINPSGGFTSTVEQLGANDGRNYAFDGSEGGRNQEVWTTKLSGGGP